MELEFTPEQDELRDAVRAVLVRECPMSLVREVVEKGVPADGLWTQMVALGWPALTVPEEHGGLGFGMVELAVVLEELGRVDAPGPFLATVSRFVPMVQEAGSAAQQAELLPPVAAGERTGTIAFAPDAVTATPEGSGYRLQGVAPTVSDPAADDIAVVARVAGHAGADGVGVFVVPGSAATATPIAPLDPSRPLAHLELDGVTVGPERVLGEPGPAAATAVERALEVATTAVALDIVGTCQTIFDVTLAYAQEREQFGVPIGSFQAIKHRFADMLISLERARATAYFAALTIAEDDEGRSLATSVAKAAAGDCAAFLAREGIQIHGGIGYTWEHDMHLWVRRVQSGAVLFGSATEHRARIADLLGV
jgi:alkylation response protein AidB-like acyl-CoA dehydrogenase